ncbi:hypothetical protein AA313_de0201609 [Arthrobotrys entomopaga]|nr:hypothetical protein AA313_de0201609 [Arthrobotrys entomopaga]
MSSKPHISIPFSSQIPIPTPPSSSGSNQPFSPNTNSTARFVHPARRRGSADSYLTEDHHHQYNNNNSSSNSQFAHPSRRSNSGRSPSYSSSLTTSSKDRQQQQQQQRSSSSGYQLGSSPNACLIIRSNSTSSSSPRSGSPLTSPRRTTTSSSSYNIRDGSNVSPNDLEFDVEPLSPFSYVPRIPSFPPSRKNSRDYQYSHMTPPVSALTQSLQQLQMMPQSPVHSPKMQYSNSNSNSNSNNYTHASNNGYNLSRGQQPQQQQQQQQEPQYDYDSGDGAEEERGEGEEGEETTIQLHMMPKNMLLPLPDRNAEMKHLLDHNALLNSQIRRRLGEERYAAAVDLWTRTRRSEVSDHEWLRRSRYFLQGDEKLWNEWALMVGWDFSRDLTRDEKGERRGVEEYAERMGHMACLEEEEE